MAWYYVKSGGTATADAGRAGTERTGSFAAMGASAYYDSLEEVIDGTTPTTNPASGDVISVSDVHSHSQAGTISYTIGISSGLPLVVQSVDDTAADTLKAGATETATGSSDIQFFGTTLLLFCYGMHWVCGDNVELSGTNSRYLFRTCEFEVTGSTDICFRPLTSADGLYARLENCTFTAGNAGSHIFNMSNGQIVEVVGGQTGGSAVTDMMQAPGTNGGFQFYATGFDMSSMASGANIISNFGEAVGSDDNAVVRMHNCRVPASAVLVEETPDPGGSQKTFEFTGVDTSDAFKYEYLDNLGKVVSENTKHVDSDTDLEGPTSYSFLINTVSGCSKTTPFRWYLPAGYADLSAASTDNIRLRITSASAITQNDVAVFVGTSDATNNTAMNIISTAEDKAESGAYIPDHSVTTGTALATDASEWTGAEANEYAIVADLSAVNVDATSPLAPTVWVEVYADLTFYLSSELVFEA